jgi:hypothetical protein
MKRLSSIATVALFMCLPAGFVLAQNAPAGSDQQAPAAAPAPAEPAPAAPAPAASPAPAAPAPAASPTTTENKPTATKKKKRTAGTSRKEIDHSIESGTVPSRYRSQVPKEYQQYIPFAK